MRRATTDPCRRFEARWLLEDDCDSRVENAWDLAQAKGAMAVHDILGKVSAELHDWSRNILGDLDKRIKKLIGELEICRGQTVTDASVRMESKL